MTETQPPPPPLSTRSEDIERASLSLKAMSHPLRLKILCVLGENEISVQDIVDAVGLAQSTVSEHLRILKAAGIISGEIDGPRVCYALNPDALAPLAEFIASLTPPPGDACCVPTRKETT